MVTPGGTLVTESATPPLKPPAGTTLIITLVGVVAPATKDKGPAGLADNVNEPTETTARLMLAVCVTPPPLPVMVMGNVPAAVTGVVAITNCTGLPAAAGVTVLGVKVAVAPVGRPVATIETELVKAPTAVSVTVNEAVPPGATLAEPGVAASANVGAITERLNEAVRWKEPTAAVNVSGMFPVAVVAEVASVSVAVAPAPAGTIELEENVAVTPAGRPIRDRFTAAPNPFRLVTVTV